MVRWAASQKMQKRSCASISIGPQPKKAKKAGQEVPICKKEAAPAFQLAAIQKNAKRSWPIICLIGCQPKNAKKASFSIGRQPKKTKRSCGRGADRSLIGRQPKNAKKKLSFQSAANQKNAKKIFSYSFVKTKCHFMGIKDKFDIPVGTTPHYTRQMMPTAGSKIQRLKHIPHDSATLNHRLISTDIQRALQPLADNISIFTTTVSSQGTVLRSQLQCLLSISTIIYNNITTPKQSSDNVLHTATTRQHRPIKLPTIKHEPTTTNGKSHRSIELQNEWQKAIS